MKFFYPQKILWLLLMISFCLSNPTNINAQTKQKAKSTLTKPSSTNSTTTENNTTGNTQQNTDTPVVAEPGKDVVAIYPFTTARGYDYDYAQSVGSAIEAGFVRSNRFTVVERSRFGQISTEERFEEVNTSQVVKLASKFGAKYIVTGHITGVSTGPTYDYQQKFSGYQTTISVAFKIIDVETSQIIVSESLTPSGTGGSTAASIGNAYGGIDAITRREIAANFPQRFPFMSVVSKEDTKKGTMLTTFKIWGGSDNGLKVGDMVEVYTLSEIVNPINHKTITEKQLVCAAQVTQINSGSTATCSVWKPRKYGKQMLDVVSSTPDKVAIEYTGGARPASFWDGF